ncbi:MAG: hypothetical protein NT154_30210, partial [Verrucomicrobia bacterium]|nr:hypothetical protein [Verrucomicrobiota bacterium]
PMNEPAPNGASNKPKGTESKGVSMAVVLAVLAGVAIVAVSLLVCALFITHGSKARLERQVQREAWQRSQAESDRQKAADEAKLALARNHQDEVLAHARNAANLIGRLQADANRLASEAAALKTSNGGRLVALDADLIAQARNFYEAQLREVPSTLDIANKLESARRIEQQVLKSIGSVYEPEADLKVTAQNAALWAEQAVSKVSQTQTLLDALVRDAKVKNPAATVPPDSLTLEAAIANLKQDEAAERQRGRVRRTDEANKVGNATVAEAEGQRIIEEARLKAAKILSDAKKSKEDFERQQALDNAQGLVVAATNQVAINQAQLDARNTVLRQKASDPKIQAKLAPFITPGIWQIKGPGTTDFKPLSFTQLQTAGSLEPSGLQKLVNIARNHYDKVRPRWNFLSLNIERSRPDEVKSAREVQDLLNELGPVLVEMGHLQP